MTNPAIQNDFSYYRRTLSRMRINNVPVSHCFELGIVMIAISLLVHVLVHSDEVQADDKVSNSLRAVAVGGKGRMPPTAHSAGLPFH